MEVTAEDTPSSVGDRESTPDADADFEAELWYEEPEPDVQEYIIQTYRNVWEQFYTWEPEASEREIANISMDILLDPETPLQDEDSLEFDESEALSSDAMQVDDSHSFSFTVYDYDLSSTRTLTCSKKKLRYYGHYPKYFACTPTSFNITHSDSFKVARFVPFDGEPNFDVLKYLDMEEFETLQWQDDWEDSDQNIIAEATIKQLISEEEGSHNIVSASDIDTVLPFTCNNVSWHMSQRDSLYWTGVANLDGNTNSKRTPQPIEQDLKLRVLNVMQKYFCAYIDCLRFQCILHPSTPWAPHYPKSLDTSKEIAKKVKQPCGDACFLSKENIDQIVLAEEAPSVIQDILQLAPDGSPCDLSIICKQPCYEIFLYRCRSILDEHIIAERKPRASMRGKPKFTYFKQDVVEYVILDTCNHEGLPCGPHVGCECFDKARHCQRNCPCALTCQLRYPGCVCLKSNPCSQKSRCQCALRNWECDPEVCRLRNTKARRKKKDQKVNHIPHFCKGNMSLQIQTKPTPRVEVKEALWGFGVFALERIRKDAFLGEYVAEVFDRHDVSRDLIWRHVTLNYNFTLNEFQDLDAMTAGNHTRFFNHSKNDNVDCKESVVNSEHRFAFFSKSDIKKGEELVFNYGEGYWKQQQH